jgi:hypothetical protein
VELIINKMKNNDLHQMLKEGKISSKTLERVNICKSYIEKKYSMKKVKEEEKKKGNFLFTQNGIFLIRN